MTPTADENTTPNNLNLNSDGSDLTIEKLAI